MVLSIAGIKYLDESYLLIANEIRERKLEKFFVIEKIRLNSAAKENSSNDLNIGDPNQDTPDRSGEDIYLKEIEKSWLEQKCRILVLTDRDCSDMTIRPDECLDKISKMTSEITPGDFVIVNVDDTDLIRHIEGLKCRVITFGFNSKARVTASSTAEDVAGAEYLCSLQSSFKSINGDVIEPGEMKILDKMGCKAYSVMAYCSFLLVTGLKKTGD
jgi:hypothetical protein